MKLISIGDLAPLPYSFHHLSIVDTNTGQCVGGPYVEMDLSDRDGPHYECVHQDIGMTGNPAYQPVH